MELERFTVPELLFNPSDVGMAQGGLPEAIHDAITSCDVGLQGSLYNNIVLTGGNTRFPGMQSRVLKELRAIAPDRYGVNVFAPEDPSNYAWMGGSLMAQDVGVLQSQFLTKENYDEWGPNALSAVSW